MRRGRRLLVLRQLLGGLVLLSVLQLSVWVGCVNLGTPQLSSGLSPNAVLPSAPRLSVILSNIQSGNNIGRICRNCLAFNASQVIVVGRGDFAGKMRSSDRGAFQRLHFEHCPSLTDAQTMLKSQGATILGVEICDASLPINGDPPPFAQHTAFMFGNEAGGLSPKQRDICDGFVYIPQYAPGGMASINVACASAITLYSFATWAKYPETIRKGEKFV